MDQKILQIAETSAPSARLGRSRAEGLLDLLVARGALPPGRAAEVLGLAARREARIADILYTRGLVTEHVLLEAQADLFGTHVIDPRVSPPDPRLIDMLGAHRCLSEGLAPWRRAGGVTIIATPRPELFERHRAELTALFGPLALAIAGESALAEAVMALRGPALALRAETRVAAEESCRPRAARKLGWRLAAAAAVVALLLTFPEILLTLLTVWAALTMIAVVALKGAAALAILRMPPPPPAALDDMPQIARLPCVSMLVPLHDEPGIVSQLVHRLAQVEYPPELLDVLLVVEEEDNSTRVALAAHRLPRWMRVVVAPEATLKTKPRALNFALDLCRGSIVGVWDAEDAPDRDQINRVVRQFHDRGAEVACLQGRLDYYNPRINWLSRCFTVEYAVWFGLILPGLVRLGLPIPLGGTTLFFRRSALEALGGWDAYNVTEDADLGIRLARHGYRAEVIDTVTREEANCRTLPWIRQRSRWIKGYMMTWAVHMRSPKTALRQMGWRRFLGFQVLFAGTLSQQLLAPLLWTYWLLFLGLWHPLDRFPSWTGYALAGVFLGTGTVNLCIGLIAVAQRRHRFLLPWVPTLALYFPLAAFAAYKAVWELATRPFFWDKTAHGLYDDSGVAPGRKRRTPRPPQDQRPAQRAGRLPGN